MPVFAARKLPFHDSEIHLIVLEDPKRGIEPNVEFGQSIENHFP